MATAAILVRLSLKSRGNRRLLRVLGAIDVTCALLLLGLGVLILVEASSGHRNSPPAAAAVLVFAVTPLAAWSGYLMTFGDVVVSAHRLRTVGLWPHSVSRNEVERLDIVRRDFGKIERWLPVAYLRGGAELPLLPLAWSPTRLQAPSSRAMMLARQRTAVDQLRTVLGVSGSDGAPG